MANKHLVYVLCDVLQEMAGLPNPDGSAQSALRILRNAVSLHNRIETQAIQLRDDTNSYQENWVTALEAFLSECRPDLEYFALLS